MNKVVIAIVAGILALTGIGIFYWQSNSGKHNIANHSSLINNTTNTTSSTSSTTSTSSSTSSTTSTSELVSSDTIDKNLVEIFYLAHPPAKAILEKVEAILEKFPEYTVISYDFDDEKSKKKVETYGLLEHSPIAIFIAGIGSFKIEDSVINLVNFPKGDAFVPSLEGSWGYDDLEKILANPDKYINND